LPRNAEGEGNFSGKEVADDKGRKSVYEIVGCLKDRELRKL
jgi:hypothetical protein